MNKLTSIIFLLIFLAFPISVFSEGETEELVKEEVNYQLPYPGMLPDHPLYGLKLARDNIYDFFIADTLKKAEFKLLMADKRLFMGILLIDKDKKDLSIEVIGEASQYYNDAVLECIKAEEEGEGFQNTKHAIIESGKKHREIIAGLLEESKGKEESSLKRAYESISQNLSKLVKNQEVLQDKRIVLFNYYTTN